MRNDIEDPSDIQESKTTESQEADHFITVTDDDDDNDENTYDAVTVERKDYVPKDRGWAWFVLLGATFDMLLLIGIVKCSGILFVVFQERFRSSSSMTSLLSTVQNICQSVTSLLAMTFGIRYTTCRNMLFTGSIITCIAYVITSQAADIRLLLFSHGVLQGTGMGFMFPTALSMVNLYFEKRRGLANSIAVSGGSVGGLIFAPMITKFFTTYGYQGCFLILAGLLLNGCVISTLLRPISFYTDRVHRRITLHQPKSEKKKLLSAKDGTNTLDRVLDLKALKKEVNENIHRQDANSVLTVSECLVNRCKATVDAFQMDMGENNKTSYSANDISKKRGGQNETYGNVQNNIKLAHSKLIKSSLFPNSSEKFIFKPMEIYVESKETPNSVAYEDSSFTENAKHFPKEADGDVKESKPDILTKKRKYKLVMNPVFWALLLQGSLICSGTLVAPIFIAPYATDIGVSVDEVAILVTALSCVDLFARILIGYISDKRWLRRSSIVAIATLVISISASLLRFYTNYAILLGYAIVLGLVSGAYFSLYAVILIDYLTLDNFQTCLGVMSLVHGFSTALVFYLVGYLKDMTGSYVVPHNVIGVTTGIGAIILFLLPVIERLQK